MREVQVHFGIHPGEKGYVVTEGTDHHSPGRKVIFTTDSRSDAADVAKSENERRASEAGAEAR